VIAPNEEVYFVAHVDGVQEGAEERFPAADDNASGAVDLLEVGRVLSTFSFSRTLVLLFSTGEEHGALGARSHVDQLSSEELGRIKYAVDVDMVGYDGDGDGVMQLWPGDDPPSLALTQMMSETIGAYGLDLTPRIHPGCQ
jgi:Zn-dependent M28 family amino/carboxypeptidase